MSRQSLSKLPRSVRQALRDNGFEYARTGKHYVFKHVPTGRTLSLSISPSCPFFERKVLADIERIKRGEYR